MEDLRKNYTWGNRLALKMILENLRTGQTHVYAGFRMYTAEKYYQAYIFRGEDKISINFVWVLVGIANTKETDGRVVKKLAAKYKI